MNKIEIVLPPHSSHLLQPLDVTVFSPPEKGDFILSSMPDAYKHFKIGKSRVARIFRKGKGGVMGRMSQTVYIVA